MLRPPRGNLSVVYIWLPLSPLPKTRTSATVDDSATIQLIYTSTQVKMALGWIWPKWQTTTTSIEVRKLFATKRLLTPTVTWTVSRGDIYTAYNTNTLIRWKAPPSGREGEQQQQWVVSVRKINLTVKVRVSLNSDPLCKLHLCL